jgi:poly-gamma-glutamate synthesis protein (capsule biosynthesis protein)
LSVAAAVLMLSACTGTHHAVSGHAVNPTATSSSGTPDATAPTAPGTSSSTSTAPQPRTVTILGTGDVLIHPQLWEQAAADAKAAGRTGYDFEPMLASIAPDVRRADLAICEMESPLAPPQGPFEGWPTFSSPPQVLTALKAVGYDSCTTASNHSIDQGYTGVKRTLDELDAAGLKHTGSARSAAEAAKPLIITEPNGVKIAQLAYAFGFNGQHTPPGEPWLANLTNIPDILAAAHRAKQAGADIVVVSMHWGVEYDTSATALQKHQAAELLASPDVDLILGDHPHVVEPAQRINGKWVIYSMGNQISRHADPVLASREGAMPMFTFTETSPGTFTVTRAEVVPTLMTLTPKLRLVDLPRALAGSGLTAALRSSYLASVSHIRTIIDALGAAKDGMTVG